LFDKKEATLNSMGTTSISHALNLAAKVEALSKSYQEYISETGIFGNHIKMVSKSFEGTLTAIEGCKNIESNWEDPDQNMEAVAEWAKKTWPANPEIAENLRKEGLSGRDLAEIVKDDELMEELGIKTKAKKIVFRNTWGLMKSTKTVQLRKKMITDQLENVSITMRINESKSIQQKLENQKMQLQLKNCDAEIE